VTSNEPFGSISPVPERLGSREVTAVRGAHHHLRRLEVECRA
jgi:hypothetical protein